MKLFSTSSEIIEKKLTENIHMTRSVFSDTTRGLDEIMSDLSELTKIMSQVSEKFEKNRMYQMNFDLFARSRQLLSSSYLCLTTGHYGSAKCLLRSVLENNDLMLLFFLHPKETTGWMKNPEWWREKENTVFSIRNRIFLILARGDSRLKPRFSRLYGELSEYVHPRPRGWVEIKERKEDGKWYIPRFPTFNKDAAKDTIRKILLIIYMTVGAFETTYHEFLPSHPETHSKVNKIFEKIRELFPRFA